MDEFARKLIERLEDKIELTWKHDYMGGRKDAFREAIEIVNQLAEEYTSTEHINCSTDLISRSAVIKELNGIYLDNPWDDKEDILEKAIGIVEHFPTVYNDGWIPCSGCRDCQHKECEHNGKV